MRHFSPELTAEFDSQLAKQMRGVDDPYAQEGSLDALAKL